MPWTKLEEKTYRPKPGAVMVLWTWRCVGCRFYAVTGGNDPGPCGNRKCRYWGGEK